MQRPCRRRALNNWIANTKVSVGEVSEIQAPKIQAPKSWNVKDVLVGSPCQECGRAFKNQSSLTRHRKLCNGNTRPNADKNR